MLVKHVVIGYILNMCELQNQLKRIDAIEAENLSPGGHDNERCVSHSSRFGSPIRASCFSLSIKCQFFSARNRKIGNLFLWTCARQGTSESK